jgi:hypothetical protein
MTWYGELSDLGDGEECLCATANMYRRQGDHALAMVYRPRLSGFDQRAGNGGLLVVLIIRIRGMIKSSGQSVFHHRKFVTTQHFPQVWDLTLRPYKRDLQ